MKRWCVLLAWMGLQMATASSDPGNLEDGVFLAHHPPGIQYSQGMDGCQAYVESFAIDSCSEQHNRIDLDGNEGESSIWYVLAAWTEEKQWCGAEFGFGEYDPDTYSFVEWGPCSPGDNLEIPTANWPGPSQGTAVTTTDTAWSGNFVPIYFFAGYAYYEGVIPLAVDPVTGFGGTGNCATPPVSSAAEFGGLGIFTNGIYVCPEGEPDGGGQDEAPGGDESGPEGDHGEEDRETFFVCPGEFYETIQDAINDAQDGDIIELCCDHTFVDTGNVDVSFLGKAITVRSECGDPERCVINCQLAGRGFMFEHGEGPESIVENVKILSGRPDG